MLQHAEAERLDLVFQALSDRARRTMLERLAQGPASVSELARPLDMTLTAVVQHVRVLEACGLVASRKQGRVRTCRLEEAALRQAESWIADRRRRWDQRLDRLGEVLAEPVAEPVATPDPPGPSATLDPSDRPRETRT